MFKLEINFNFYIFGNYLGTKLPQLIESIET